MPSMPSSHACSSSFLKQQIINTVKPFKKGVETATVTSKGNGRVETQDPQFRTPALEKLLLSKNPTPPTLGCKFSHKWYLSMDLSSQASCSSLAKQKIHQLTTFTIQEVMCIKGSSMEFLSMPQCLIPKHVARRYCETTKHEFSRTTSHSRSDVETANCEFLKGKRRQTE